MKSSGYKYPLTHPQKRIWYEEKVYDSLGKNILAPVILFKSDINYPLMEKAINITIRDNDGIRLRVEDFCGEPRQFVAEYQFCKIDLLDFTAASSGESFHEWINRISGIPFEIFNSNLFYFALIKIAGNEGGFLIKMHHLISDTSTIGIISDCIINNYRMLKDGTVSNKRSTFSYIDFIEWEHKYKHSVKFERDKKYWEMKLEGILSEESAVSFKSHYRNNELCTRYYDFPDEMSKLVNSFCEEHATSVFRVFISIVYVLLSKLYAKDKLLLGTAIHNRFEAGLKGVAGMLVSTVPFYIDGSVDMAFVELLNTVKKELKEVVEYQCYPFDLLVQQLRMKKCFREKLFDVVVVYHSESYTEGADVHYYSFGKESFPLTFHIGSFGAGKNLKLYINYRTDCFTDAEIEIIYKRVMIILTAVLKRPSEKLETFSITLPQEERIIAGFNDSFAEFPQNMTIHKLFEKQAEKTPDNIALIYRNERIKYKELNEKANKLARILRRKGVRPDSIVGIMAERSTDMLIGILGILKSGGAYLPIGISYPRDRIRYMLEDSRAEILLMQRDKGGSELFDGEIISLEGIEEKTEESSDLESVNTPRDLAYIIYTSGSTGKPKGVMIEHRGVVNILTALERRYSLGGEDTFLFKTAYTFDASVIELFMWFISAGSLSIMEEGEEKEPFAIIKAIQSNKVTHIFFVPSMLTVFIETLSACGIKISESLKYIFLGGEAISAEVVKRFRKLSTTVRLENLYGPTETTVCSTVYSIENIENESRIPIGKVLDNTRGYILGSGDKLQPLGVAGELCISGCGLARGYLNQPELTREKFAENPYEPGNRMYRTGDLARWLPDGNIDFLGRMDNQVKVRGYRLELGEIEGALLKHKAVREAVVLAKDSNNGQKYLCAYVVSNERLTASELRLHLACELPDYMIPSYYVHLERLPLNSNGKVDRKALPEPDSSQNTGTEYAAPGSEIEKRLAEVWEEVLKVGKIGIQDNFFDLGGDSLKATRVVAKLIANYRISVNYIFENKTIAALAKKISEVSLLEEIRQSMKAISGAGVKENQGSGYQEELLKQQALLYQRKNEKYLVEKKYFIRKNYKNVLLCGATGYLGIYILKELLEETDSTVFLLIRAENGEYAEEKLTQKLRFYFGEGICERYSHRIFAAAGDIAKGRLGLPEKDYEVLSDRIDCIINSAANVKHYGEYGELYKPNVAGTRNLLEFALFGKKKDYNHISTISVASGSIQGKPEVFYTEYDYDVGQISENYYVKSKQEAEKVVLEARREGVNCNIFRVGNLVFNSENGSFQENIEGNDFYKMMKAYIKLAAFPVINSMVYDFSFINHVSRAVVLLYDRGQLKNETYHVFNPNRLRIWQFGEFVRRFEPGVRLLEPVEFIDYLSEKYLNGINTDYAENILVQYSSILKAETQFYITAEKTNLLLNKIGFRWPELEERHVQKMIEYCRKVNYL